MILLKSTPSAMFVFLRNDERHPGLWLNLAHCEAFWLDNEDKPRIRVLYAGKTTVFDGEAAIKLLKILTGLEQNLYHESGYDDLPDPREENENPYGDVASEQPEFDLIPDLDEEEGTWMS
jgi:hypothetical protein